MINYNKCTNYFLKTELKFTKRQIFNIKEMLSIKLTLIIFTYKKDLKGF